MGKRFKVICLDLDGTLLDQQSQISKTNIKTLQECLTKGIRVFLVTGRPYCFARYYADKISSQVEVIAANGGCYEYDGKVVEKWITKESINEIVRLLCKYNTPAFFKGKVFIYTHENQDKRFTYDHMNEQDGFPFTKSYTDLSWTNLSELAQNIVKILVYNFDKEKLNALRKEVSLIQDISVSSYNDISFDVNGDKVNKGWAIEQLMSKHNIKKEEIISFGDSENDLAMFQMSGYAVAMANAKEEIKKQCNEVTLSNDEDGVSYLLKKYI